MSRQTRRAFLRATASIASEMSTPTTEPAGCERSGFQTLRAELADAQRAARAKTAGSQAEALGFSLAMFEHASAYTDVYRALVGGRGGSVAINEIRGVLSEIARKELSGVEDKEAVPQEVRVDFVVATRL